MPIGNVLITGGSTGIGRACVERFAREGDATVWFTYRSGRARAEELVACLAAEGRGAAAFELDQGDWESHQRLLAALPGPVDVLINNAAVGSQTVEQYAQGPAHTKASAFFQINAVGPLWLIEQLLPGMRERGHGKIVNVASVGGGIGQFPGFHPADGMSKAALAYLTRHLAADLVHTPVHVFALCPGAVETEMFEASTLRPLGPERRAAFTAGLPGGRLIRPEEIAELAYWLAGEHSAALHGAVIDASMGLGVHPGLLTANPVTGGAA
ncbi:SDR family NAD(P)-dependent oxidoreductase [Streptomyces johnsoniae]|uniref:SDR family oxidoreductase n=1 Tax=Streptomyces johnsoniae TaxID=3075532 RepID=A0ABU2SCE4_9ACTN|nr:SDR family oxidoreductase [Streptomyces sp. DSM 41886]MDT0446657.1 SDR family oxidoreductase [Streptomyces sp. DSM 41886]